MWNMGCDAMSYGPWSMGWDVLWDKSRDVMCDIGWAVMFVMGVGGHVGQGIF